MKLLINPTTENPSLLDTSELYRPEKKFAQDKEDNKYRVYDTNSTDPIQARVKRTYYEMHTKQTMEFVLEKREKWLKFNHFEANIFDALDKLNDLVDESDPDLDLPNIVHAFQTAEQIRADHPDKEWMQLTGLIHDLGKVMAFYDEPQWAVVGDTFPVGCAPQNSIVFGTESFKNNPDIHNEKYNTQFGIYEKGCGIENITMSWGHDEYLYHVLINHGATIPEEGLYMIRYHSFYPWHSGNDYGYFNSPKDLEMLEWVREFQKYDLYTKSIKQPDIESLKPYYQGLIDKYIPGLIKF